MISNRKLDPIENAATLFILSILDGKISQEEKFELLLDFITDKNKNESVLGLLWSLIPFKNKPAPTKKLKNELFNNDQFNDSFLDLCLDILNKKQDDSTPEHNEKIRCNVYNDIIFLVDQNAKNNLSKNKKYLQLLSELEKLNLAKDKSESLKAEIIFLSKLHTSTIVETTISTITINTTFKKPGTKQSNQTKSGHKKNPVTTNAISSTQSNTNIAQPKNTDSDSSQQNKQHPISTNHPTTTSQLNGSKSSDTPYSRMLKEKRKKQEQKDKNRPVSDYSITARDEQKTNNMHFSSKNTVVETKKFTGLNN